MLALPADAGAQDRDVDQTAILAAWSAYLGWDGPLLLVRHPERARRLLMSAAGVSAGEPVGLPANCRRAHSETVKRSGGVPRFIDFLPDLQFDPDTPGFDEVRILWAAPAAVMPSPDPLGRRMLVDHGDALPAPAGESTLAAATLWGLHLAGDDDDTDEGALIVFHDSELYLAAVALLAPDDLPDVGRAMAQCERLRGADGLAARHLRVLEEARFGLEVGAGPPMMPTSGLMALPHGLAVRIPEEADLATFISYVRNENVPLDWLPEVRPMFYVAYQVTQDRARTFQTAANLARWVISPLGPDYDDDQIVHAVLGLLKAAEYTGVRWYTDSDRAAWYGNLMREWNGPTHDAFQPAFLAQSAANDYLPRSLEGRAEAALVE